MVAAVVGVAASAYGAYSSSKAAKKGAQSQAESNAAAIEEQRRQYDLSRQDMQPFMQAGYGALDRQEAFLNGDWSGFEKSPDYAWAVDQGTKALDRGAAARGGLYSGGADADRISLGQGLATQYANNYWAKLAGQAGLGFNASSNLGALGADSANQIGELYNSTGKARASGYAASANAWNNFGKQVLDAYGQSKYGGDG